MGSGCVFKTVAVLFGTAAVFALASDNTPLNEADKLMLGKSFFEKPWVASPASTTARDGLGPLFNANSCISCHPKNGRGVVFADNGSVHPSVLVKLAVNSSSTFGNPTKATLPEPTYGSQINTQANGTLLPEAQLSLHYQTNQTKRFIYDDGQTVTLRKPLPKLSKLNYGKLADDTVMSIRIAPSLLGVGLLEQIDERDIITNEQTQQRTKGRINWVWSTAEQQWVIGRFGHKASVANIVEQTATAAFEDMGLTNRFFPRENCPITVNCPLSHDLDLTDVRLDAIAFYVSQLTPPNQQTPDDLFVNTGCADCHRPSYLLTNGTTIYPYSDLLVHNMGEGLADGRAEFNATGSDWRTAPLWGLSGQQNFLHDGRAETIEQAILWHGGDADYSRQQFIELPQQQRQQLLNFLQQL